tara:strand:+ start:4792 stop:4989 length:198 start_codon:yes stop_codon:yes gene_type:complete
MKIKLKDGVTLPNNWKSCGCTAEDWQKLNAGKSIDVDSVPELIKDNVDVESSTLKPKEKKMEGSK